MYVCVLPEAIDETVRQRMRHAHHPSLSLFLSVALLSPLSLEPSLSALDHSMFSILHSFFITPPTHNNLTTHHHRPLSSCLPPDFYIGSIKVVRHVVNSKLHVFKHIHTRSSTITFKFPFKKILKNPKTSLTNRQFVTVILDVLIDKHNNRSSADRVIISIFCVNGKTAILPMSGVLLDKGLYYRIGANLL